MTNRHYDRLAALRSAVAHAGLSGAFLAPGADLEYLTGIPRVRFMSDRDRQLDDVQGCCVGLRGDPVFVVTHSEWNMEAGLSNLAGSVVRYDRSEHVAAIREAISRAGIDGGRIAVSDDMMFAHARLIETVTDLHLTGLSPYIQPLREQKDEEELRSIECAGIIALHALTATVAKATETMHRRDFLAELTHQLLAHGSEGIPYGPDLHAAGPRCDVRWAAIEGDAVITPPAAVSVDMSASFQGYRADIGRTVAFGSLPAVSADALEVVKRAQEAAAATLVPDVHAGDVDAAARRVMTAGGLGDAFWIPVGHGVGLEIHEPPILEAGSTHPLPLGSVVSVEVGAWEDGSLSAFWEDQVAVGEDGPRWLTRSPQPLFIVGQSPAGAWRRSLETHHRR